MFYIQLKSRSGRLLTGLLFLSLAAGPARAQAPGSSSPSQSSSSPQNSQTAQQPPDLPEIPQGLRLASVSVFGAYYSSALASNTLSSSFNYTNANLLGSDEAYGATANIVYFKTRPRSTFSIHYTPSYIGRVRFSEWNAFNQSLGANWTRQLSPHWDYSVSLNVSEQNLDQFLFNPTPFGAIASTPATFDQLTGAILKGQLTNGQIASLLTGATAASSPAQTLIFGNRILAMGLTNNFSYEYSPRLSFNFNFGATRSQHLHNFQDDRIAGRGSYLLNNYTSANAGLGASYSITPRTSIGMNANTARSFSSVARYYTSNLNLTLSHIFNRQWFGSVHGGAGLIVQGHNRLTHLSSGPHYTAGAALGYKTRENTFLLSYNRSVSSSYGLGASYGDAAQLSWAYRPLSGPWGLFASATEERLVGGTYLGHLNAWLAQAGASRRLTRHIFASAQFAYIDSRQNYQIGPYAFARETAEVSLSWSPSPNAPFGLGY